MPYVNIPNDLTKISDKIIFGLTKRQLIAFLIAALIGFPVFLLCLLVFRLGLNISSFAMIVVMLPIFIFAFYERYGQKPEVFVKSYIKTKIKSPAIRPYRVCNLYAALDDAAFIAECKQIEVLRKEQKKSKKKGQRTNV